MIPEFTGRFPIAVPIDALSVEDFVRILKEPNNNLIAQMKFYFESDDVELEFTDDAIQACAQLAHEQGTGARGLKSILERTLMPYMFALAEMKQQGIAKIEITEQTIRDAH
jgi:ATP-dependent Clp protease ATP-binding subunit ClpX